MFSPTKIRKFCAYQDRSITEVRTKLKGYPLLEEEIEAIVNQLIEEDFLNDERFASGFVKSKLQAKGWGYAKIRFHLQQKGIAESLIKNALNEIDETDWNEQLHKNIEKWKRSNELSQTTYPKLIRFLASKGYKLSEIMQNIKFLWFLCVALVLYSCTTRYEIPSLKQKYYYTTQIDHKPYIILIDTIIEVQSLKFKVQSSKDVLHTAFHSPRTVHPTTLKSTAYLIDNSEFTKPQQFRVVYKKRKVNALLNGKKISFSNSFTVYEPPVITEFPQRYLDSLFATHIYSDVVYAQAEGYWDSNFSTEDQIGKALLGGVVSTIKKRKLNLKMDIYVPQNAGKTERPLLMLMHGGAFYVGDKSSNAIVEACKYFASLGYTTASINYRLGFQPTKVSIERSGYMAVQDASAAVRFLITNAHKYKIDTSCIFVGGSSAGGITALNLAFMQNTNRPESSHKSLLHKDLGNIESVGIHNDITFQIKSVANLWGAVDDLNILNNNNISVLSYHAKGDPLVPYGYDYPMQKIVKKFAPVFFSKIYGSGRIHDELIRLGYREKLVTVDTQTHNLWETKGKQNDTYFMIVKDMKTFFYNDLIPNPVTIKHDTEDCQRYFITNATEVDVNTWQCEGGFIINNNEKEIFVIWRTDATDRKLISSGAYKNGAAFKTDIEK